MTHKHVKELVRQVKSGSEEAFTQLVNLYGDRIYNLALRILKNPDDAADVLQETFLAVYEKIHTFDGRSDFFTWLYRIATNFSLMKLRKRRRTVLSDEELETRFDSPNHISLAEWQSVPLKDMLSEEFKKYLNEAVDSLPEIYKTVFVLRDLENLSIKETSKILGITESNVKIRLKRARMYLRERLAGYMKEMVKEAK